MSSDKNFLWAYAKPDRASEYIDLKNLKQLKPILVEEPILPTVLKPDQQIFNQIQNAKIEPEILDKKSKQIDEEKNYKLRPSIDSYIINTIKLNKILDKKINFEDVEFFRKKKKIFSKKLKAESPKIQSNQDLKLHLKQFISIMSIHVGFSHSSSLALDTLVDVLDHFLQSFFILLKNLSQIKPIDLRKNEPEGFCDNYISEAFIQQALIESGLGTIGEIKEFYVNDVILYYKNTFKKVNKMYEEYRARKNGENSKNSNFSQAMGAGNKLESDDIHLDEFMKDNEFLNDETNSILEELFTDLNVPHLDEEMSKLFQMIGNDPFSLINDEFPTESEAKKNQ